PVAHLPTEAESNGDASLGPLTESAASSDLVIVAPASMKGPSQVTVKDAAFANIRIGQWTGAALVPCGDFSATNASATGRSPMSWESLRRSSDGAVQYTTAQGWFDLMKCKGGVSTRVTTVARPIVPGLVYGFRSCAASCADHESVVLLMPRVQAVVSDG